LWNEQLDNFIHNELIQNNEVYSETSLLHGNGYKNHRL